ncbi:MAG TPA: hypothetical protein VIZ69_09690 [Thermoanaerobaculia bacterium]
MLAMPITYEIDQAQVRLELGRVHALGPTAVIVCNDVSYGILRMLETLVEDVCDVRPFRDRADGEAWLQSVRDPRPPKPRQ